MTSPTPLLGRRNDTGRGQHRLPSLADASSWTYEPGPSPVPVMCAFAPHGVGTRGPCHHGHPAQQLPSCACRLPIPNRHASRPSCSATTRSSPPPWLSRATLMGPRSCQRALSTPGVGPGGGDGVGRGHVEHVDDDIGGAGHAADRRPSNGPRHVRAATLVAPTSTHMRSAEDTDLAPAVALVAGVRASGRQPRGQPCWSSPCGSTPRTGPAAPAASAATPTRHTPPRAGALRRPSVAGMAVRDRRKPDGECPPALALSWLATIGVDVGLGDRAQDEPVCAELRDRPSPTPR
jgi:hypothetical protein